MRTSRVALGTFLSLFTLALLSCATVAPTTAQEKSLYERLGRYDAIAAVSDDFILRLTQDPPFQRFFTSFSTASQQRLRQLIVEQICEAAGGPCVYTGRTMKASHAGLGITEQNWQAAVAHFVASLDKFKVPPKEKNDLLAIVSSVKKDIVEK